MKLIELLYLIIKVNLQSNIKNNQTVTIDSN